MISRPKFAKIDVVGPNVAYRQAGPQSFLKLLLVDGTHGEGSMP
jgi:hypothetical protein